MKRNEVFADTLNQHGLTAKTLIMLSKSQTRDTNDSIFTKFSIDNSNLWWEGVGEVVGRRKILVMEVVNREKNTRKSSKTMEIFYIFMSYGLYKFKQLSKL